MYTLWEQSRRVLRDIDEFMAMLLEPSVYIEPLVGSFKYLTLDRSPPYKIQKRIFLIRHPQTNEAVDRIYRGDQAEITEKGWEQAYLVAGRLADMGGITHIVTSTLPRSRLLAHRIADVIGETQRRPVIMPSDLFVEVKKPSILLNKHRDSRLHVEVMRPVRRFFDLNYRHSDEENRWRLERRVFEALRYLAELEAENIVVVTHGKFLLMLFHYLHQGGTLRRFYAQTDRLMKHDHTAISRLDLAPSYRTGRPQWNIIRWNDLAHNEILVPISTLKRLDALP